MRFRSVRICTTSRSIPCLFALSTCKIKFTFNTPFEKKSAIKLGKSSFNHRSMNCSPQKEAEENTKKKKGHSHTRITVAFLQASLSITTLTKQDNKWTKIWGLNHWNSIYFIQKRRLIFFSSNGKGRIGTT